ncbi:hypothetical protein ACJ72_07492 [Emergomyces africanus]|uniref:Uncharacterized protein n=1 Tax=Emergomyces africanus TaxID=1955775 RepID=A0A1B7NN08_9EURO|nr:hypothetical protein ACJ72_07492 [Emergomyces africanus]
MENQRELFCSPDIPLPSIELSHDPASSVASIFDMAATQPITDNALQVPPRGRVDPRTPPAQIRGTPVDERPCWTYGDATEYGDSIQRPSSACSNFSDSSVASSATSYTSHPSIGGSCTSPESEIQDPFLSYPFTSCKRELETPSKPCNVQETPSNTKVISPRWTAEMDRHLWNTYQIYLQDPRITPFKMVPGSLPPLGVSHRVAREARKTWPRVKNRHKHGSSTLARTPVPVIYSEELGGNGKQKATMRSGSTTPTARATPAKPTWPRSDSSTRRRLKELCKRKFSIAPHYQRLIQSRSPSPFLETFPESTTRTPLQLGASSHRKAASFATRDLGVSLVSSSLPTQVAELGPPVNDLDNSLESNWFNDISGEHEQSLISNRHSDPPSLDYHHHHHDGHGHNHSNNHASATHELSNPTPRLGSPFMYHTWGPDSSRRRFRSITPASHCETIHASSLKARSPGGREDPFGNAHKRRALHQLEDELDSSGSSLQRPFPDLIRQTRYNDIGQRRVRVRNRGVTTGAIGGSRGRLDQLFTPPAPFPAFSGLSTTSNSATATTTNAATATTAVTTSTINPTTTSTIEGINNGQKGQEQDDSNDNIINNNHHLRLGDDIKRLGSPFHSCAPFNKYSNITRRHHGAPSPYSPRHAPSLSDPFISTTFASMLSTTASEREHQRPTVPMSNYCQERSESAVTTPRAHFDDPETERNVGSGVRVGMGMGVVDGDDVLKLDTPSTPFS